MEANRVLYKYIVDRHECTFRNLTNSVYELVCSNFVIFFGFLFVIVMSQSAQERLFTVKVLQAVLFSWPILVFTIHISPSDYNCYQSANMLQRLPHNLNNLTVARLLHKGAHSLVKYSQNIAKNAISQKKLFCLIH